MCGKRFGIGLLFLFCLSQGLYSEETNLYEVLTSWSTTYENKLNSLELKLADSQIQIANLSESIAISENESNILALNSETQANLLTQQSKTLQTVEQQQQNSQTVLEDLTRSLNSTERNLKLLQYVSVALATAIVVLFIT